MRTRRVVPVALLVPTLVLAGCLDLPIPGWPSGDEGPLHATLTVVLTGPPTAEVGEAARFTAEVKGARDNHAYFLWSFGDGTEEKAVDLSETTHTFAEAGRYTVRLVAVDAEGARGEASTTLGVALDARYAGTLAPQPVGEPAWSTSFPVAVGGGHVAGEVNLTRPEGPVANALPAAAVVRIHAPGGPGPGAPAFERRVEVPANGAVVTFEIPAPSEGAWTLSVALDGSGGMAAFAAVVHVPYA
ncbi:MAG TPA: PKD domain-containing protein [Candidatus Thermoplasmatota archaeon]|nr:PKD domain-containing protein [Candidatus Thermoplasmatota archaeon]